ncbi:MAG: hypothetical protein ABIZ04_19975 [Opitutus sp.]
MKTRSRSSAILAFALALIVLLAPPLSRSDREVGVTDVSGPVLTSVLLVSSLVALFPTLHAVLEK